MTWKLSWNGIITIFWYFLPVSPELKLRERGLPLHLVHQQLGQLGYGLLNDFGNFNELNGSSTTPLEKSLYSLKRSYTSRPSCQSASASAICSCAPLEKLWLIPRSYMRVRSESQSLSYKSWQPQKTNSQRIGLKVDLFYRIGFSVENRIF